MTGKIESLTFAENGDNLLTIRMSQDCRKLYDDLHDVLVDVSIAKARKKRSLDANAYFHVLVNEIARKVGVSDEEVKRTLVTEYGVIDTLEDGSKAGAMLPHGVDVHRYYKYAKRYKSMTMDGRKYDCYLFYKETHLMNSAEMADLIDGAIYNAKELGIETLPPQKLAAMKEKWNGKRI